MAPCRTFLLCALRSIISPKLKGSRLSPLLGGTFIWAGMARQPARTSIDAWLSNTYKAAAIVHLIANKTQEKCIKNPG